MPENRRGDILTHTVHTCSISLPWRLGGYDPSVISPCLSETQ